MSDQQPRKSHSSLYVLFKPVGSDNASCDGSAKSSLLAQAPSLLTWPVMPRPQGIPGSSPFYPIFSPASLVPLWAPASDSWVDAPEDHWAGGGRAQGGWGLCFHRLHLEGASRGQVSAPLFPRQLSCDSAQ